MTRQSPQQDAVALARTLAATPSGTPMAPTLLAQIDQLFAANQDRAYAACLHYVGDPERARDLAQDTLLTAFQSFHSFRGESLFGTWLHGIARLKCYNAMRKRTDTLSDDGVIDASDPAGNALSKLRADERRSLLLEAATTVLDATEQEAVYLRYVEQLPQARITDLLSLDNDSAARGVLQRCRRKLARELRRKLYELGHTSSLFGQSES